MPPHHTQPAITVTERCSDALRALYGEFAETIAQLDPFPHSRALDVPAPVLHLALLALSRADERAAAQCLAPHAELGQKVICVFGQPVKQARAVLRRLPLTSLPKSSYERLNRLLGCEAARATLAHADLITRVQIDVLDRLPASLRRPCIARHVKNEQTARLIAYVAQKLLDGSGPNGLGAFADQLNATRSPETFWRCVEIHLLEQLPTFAPPLNFGDHRFHAITTPRGLLLAARSFDNCLADYLGEAISGQMGFYVWSNAEHRAVIGVRPQIGRPGIIHEIKGPRNGDLPALVMAQIMEPLLRAGFEQSDDVKRKTGALRRIHKLIREEISQAKNLDHDDDPDGLASLLRALG